MRSARSCSRWSGTTITVSPASCAGWKSMRRGFRTRSRRRCAPKRVPCAICIKERPAIHFLDKPLSFDDAQDAIYRLPPPLIIVGGAGSGKTALAFEKLKSTTGEVLYVTQSAFLARHARDLYYAAGFEGEDQDVAFLSYRELMESIRVPAGREATWRDFCGWFARVRQAYKGVDAHQAFEEIRGVLAAQAGGVLSREAYRALGVRQSIFPAPERDRLYDLFEKYRGWLAEAKLFDTACWRTSGARSPPRATVSR